MILKALSPTSFGRFQNRELPLGGGVNLIDAPNEAGKSTLAAFISGMLYGFFRRDVKKRLYAPAFERYRPWDSPGRYFGALTLSHEGVQYRLERNFLKDEVRLYDAATGRDETDRMPYNPSLRIHEPGQFFLGISQSAFEGTLYVPQQAVRTGDDLGQALRDRIDALSETGSGGLSASGAIKWLDARRAELGTPRRGGTPLGARQKRLDDLIAERQKSEKRRADAARDGQDELALKREIERLEADQREDRAALERAARHVRWRRAADARAYKGEMDELEAEFRGLPEDGGLSEGSLEALVEDARQAERLKGQADDRQKELSDLDGEITRALVARFEALLPEKSARGMIVAGAALLLLALAGFAFSAAFILAAPAAVLLGLGIARSLRDKKASEERASILDALGVSSPEQFGELPSPPGARGAPGKAESATGGGAKGSSAPLERADAEDRPGGYRETARYGAAFEDTGRLSALRGEVLQQLSDVRAQRDVQAEEIRRILASAGLDAEAGGASEALDTRLGQLRKRKGLAEKLKDKRRLLDQCLGGEDYDQLIESASPEPEPPRAADTVAREIERRAGEIRDKTIKMNRHAANREAIEDGCRTLPEIDGEAALVQEEIDRLTLKAEAIDEARARIERASDEMRRKVSPALGRAVAAVAGHVTGGRYDRLMIDTDLKMQALADGQSVSPEQLSGGTADAIHLALRLGLIEFLMGGRACPVILDDSFAQLDDARAQRMLETIATFSENRQALLLTCQMRTRRMLEELKIPYQIVQL